jgi:hypothetical protein
LGLCQPAQEQKQLTEKAIGRADKQRELASAEIEVDIKKNRAEARKKEEDGEAYYVAETGRAKGAEVEAVGLARAKALQGTDGSPGSREHGPCQCHRTAIREQTIVRSPGHGNRRKRRGGTCRNSNELLAFW